MVEECEPRSIFLEEEGCVAGNIETCQRDDKNLQSIEEICDGVNLGLFPNPESCTSYILCIFGNGQLEQCQSDRPVFDAVRGVCAEGN